MKEKYGDDRRTQITGEASDSISKR